MGMKKDAPTVIRALILRTGQDTWSHICSHGHILGHIEEKKTFFRCNSKQTCTIPVSNGQFGDPCSGVRKYFEATFCPPVKDHTKSEKYCNFEKTFYGSIQKLR